MEDKFYAVERFLAAQAQCHVSGIRFAQSIGVDESTLRKWLRLYNLYTKEGNNRVHNGGGRPRLLDTIAEDFVRTSISNLVRQQHTPTYHEVKLLIVRGAQETQHRRGFTSGSLDVETVSETYVRNFFKALKLEKGTVQLKTNARIIAEADPRNAYSMICLVKGFCDGLSPRLIFNWDATQFVISDDLHAKGVYIKAEKLQDQPLTAEGSGNIGFAIKYYHLHNSA